MSDKLKALSGGRLKPWSVIKKPCSLSNLKGQLTFSEVYEDVLPVDMFRFKTLM